MRFFRGFPVSLISGSAVALCGGSVFAQESAPAAEVAPAPAAEAAPAPAATEAAPAEAAPAEAAPAEEGHGFSYQFFGDAYVSMQTAQPGTIAPAHRAYDSGSYVSGQGVRNEDGFSLAFAGIDLSYDGGAFGATTSLRFGPGVPEYYAADPLLFGLGAITQAYVTWKPIEKLTLDFGEFGTIYGAEVAESWINLNYTRGALYYQFQPFWHTGLRAAYQFTDELVLKVIVANEQNSINLGTGSVNVGAQIAYTKDNLGIFAGALIATDSAADTFLDRFFDLVVTYGLGDLTLIGNADLNFEVEQDTRNYGLSLAAGYKFTDAFGVALRGEYLDPNADVGNDDLVTGTLTLDTKPVPGTDMFVLRWDNRVEYMANQAFFDRSGANTDMWFTSTIGAVVHTDGTF